MEKNNGSFLSVVVPVFNEKELIEQTLFDISEVCRQICTGDKKFEILVVNDGSTDGSDSIAKNLSKSITELKVIDLAINSGHMAALTAGYKVAGGEWIATMDADGQDPPKYLVEMMAKVNKENADICYGIRNDRKSDALRHRIFSPIYYKFLNLSTNKQAPSQAADFRLISKRVLEQLNGLNESNRIFRVLIPDLKFASTYIYYSRNPRKAGKSKYGFRKLSLLAIRSFLATAGLPVRILSIFSLIISFLTLLIAAWIFIISFFGKAPTGWASLSLLISGVLFFQSFSTFLISEVLLQVNSDIRKRPLYQLKRVD